MDKKKNKERRYRLSDNVARALGLQVKPYYKRYNITKEQEKKLLNKMFLATVEEDVEFEKAKNRKYDCDKQRFIVSWAQSETDVHEGFLTNIEAYAKFIDADIHIICGRYKNPTSLGASNKIKKQEKNKTLWHPRLQPYLDANRQNIHEYLCILADVKIQPTAFDPLSGMNSLTALESCILGHPHLYLRSLPILPNYPHKLLLTTGAVTVPNYTDTKLGKRGEFHHQLAFVVIELDGEHFHVRQVQGDKNGNFYDLFYCIENGKIVEANEPYPAIVLGDIHLGVEDKQLIEDTFKLIDKLNFEKIYLHDIFDGSSINHHELHNPFKLLEKESINGLDLRKEVEYMIDWFNERSGYEFTSIMSNHNDFLDRWLMNSDWREVPNKEMYLKLALLKSQNPTKSVLTLLLEEVANVECLEYGESLRLKGYELGLHGDKGTNGSRCSPNQLKNLNTKTITGHSHTPSRQLGSVVVGTSTKLNLGYNIGLSSWMQSHAIIYPNSKVSQINYVNNKFTTLK